jgi:hypothetical protein
MPHVGTDFPRSRDSTSPRHPVTPSPSHSSTSNRHPSPITMSEQHPNGQRQAPAGSSGVSDHNEDVSADDDLPGTATFERQNDGSLKKKPKAPRRRKKFHPERRKEVAEVRRRGACHKCREKKIAVSQPLIEAHRPPSISFADSNRL